MTMATVCAPPSSNSNGTMSKWITIHRSRTDGYDLESRHWLSRRASTSGAARRRLAFLFLVILIAAVTSSAFLLKNDGGIPRTLVSLDLTPVVEEIVTKVLASKEELLKNGTLNNTTKATHNTPSMGIETTRRTVVLPAEEVTEPPKHPRNIVMQKHFSVPVVYFQMQNRIPEAHYLWEAICSSLQYDNHVVLVTNARVLKIPAQLRNRFEVFTFNETLEAERNQGLTKFLSLYRGGWGYKEPYERICIERFFFLEVFMEARGFGHIFYMDSDATLMSKLEVSDFPHGCEALLPMKASTGPTNFHDYGWSLYIGLGSMLSKAVLSDFTPFVSKLYENSSDVLEEKFEKRPYVTDMTIWYLYAIAASETFREESAAVASRNFTDRLPATTQRQFCDARNAKFVSNGLRLWQWQIRKNQTHSGKKLPRNIHFQGANKRMMEGLCLQH